MLIDNAHTTLPPLSIATKNGYNNTTTAPSGDSSSSSLHPSITTTGGVSLGLAQQHQQQEKEISFLRFSLKKEQEKVARLRRELSSLKMEYSTVHRHERGCIRRCDGGGDGVQSSRQEHACSSGGLHSGKADDGTKYGGILLAAKQQQGALAPRDTVHNGEYCENVQSGPVTPEASGQQAQHAQHGSLQGGGCRDDARPTPFSSAPLWD